MAKSCESFVLTNCIIDFFMVKPVQFLQYSADCVNQNLIKLIAKIEKVGKKKKENWVFISYLYLDKFSVFPELDIKKKILKILEENLGQYKNSWIQGGMPSQKPYREILINVLDL